MVNFMNERQHRPFGLHRFKIRWRKSVKVIGVFSLRSKVKTNVSPSFLAFGRLPVVEFLGPL